MPAPVTRAVIPAGGFGTRLLPATKSMPKEMMPVLDKPAIQYVVEEAAASGILDVLIVTGRSKRAIEDHFDETPELEAFLRSKGQEDVVRRLHALTALARISYVRQSQPRGLGHAVLQAEHHLRGEPFAVLLGDDIVVGDHPATKELVEVYDRTCCSVFGVQKVHGVDISKYGVPKVEPQGNGLYKVTDIVEKPSAADAPSDLAVIGRYVFTPGILPVLAKTPPGKGGEVQLTDAMRSLLQQEDMYCVEFSGKRYDVGTLTGWLETVVALALEDPRTRDVVLRAVRDAQ